MNFKRKISWIKTPKAVLCSGWGSSPHWFLFTWRFSLFGHLIDRRGRPCDRITLFTQAQLFSAMPASKCFSFLSCFSYEYILCEWNQAKNAFGNARFGFMDRPLPVPDLFDLTGKTQNTKKASYGCRNNRMRQTGLRRRLKAFMRRSFWTNQYVFESYRLWIYI